MIFLQNLRVMYRANIHLPRMLQLVQLKHLRRLVRFLLQGAQSNLSVHDLGQHHLHIQHCKANCLQQLRRFFGVFWAYFSTNSVPLYTHNSTSNIQNCSFCQDNRTIPTIIVILHLQEVLAHVPHRESSESKTKMGTDPSGNRQFLIFQIRVQEEERGKNLIECFLRRAVNRATTTCIA